jgi:signal peptidase I
MPEVAAQAKPAENKSSGGIKETIEQILIAFVLAFIFRCFLVEAFVIPTGSMAPTLLGAHVDYRCPDCGFDYKVNYSSPTGQELAVEPIVSARLPNSSQMVPRAWQVCCPNCGYRLPRFNPGDDDNQATGAPVKGGDRILVMKYQYLLSSPRRWDVVVFKADNNLKDPQRVTQFADNYIKRLVGLPGDTLMILDGDLYASDSDKPVDELTAADFTIRPKSKSAQDAMWRSVYDNDFQPRGLGRTYIDPTSKRTEIVDPVWSNPWKTSGDVQADRSTFKVNSPSASAMLGFDPEVAPGKQALTDWLAYAQTSYNGYMNAADLFNINHANATLPVSDLKLSLVYQRASGDGPLELRMSKRQDLFIARVDASGVSILRQPLDGSAPPVEVMRDASVKSVGVGRPSRVEFSNVDYQLTLKIDGKEVLATTPKEYSPDISALLAEYGATQLQPKSQVSIRAENQVSEISHVGLWRDVYYVNRVISNPPTLAEGPAVPWASPEPLLGGNSRGKLIRLNADEFFVLGDNTRMSLDGRYWQGYIDFIKDENLVADAGRVPKRLMIGKAFFVYWPAADRATSYIPFGIIPDFGSMRFIR